MNRVSSSPLRRASNAAVESLELRRLFNGSYDLERTILDTDGGTAYQGFGRAVIATSGNLALIGSPGLVATPEENVEINTSRGKATLVDTTTGAILRTFNNPAAPGQFGDRFGTAVAFVDGKIAISAPEGREDGVGKVYLYDNYADDLPDAVIVSPDLNAGTFANFGTAMTVIPGPGGDEDLAVSSLFSDASGAASGAVYRWDLDNLTGEPAVFAPDPIDDPAITQMGGALASDGTFLYATGILLPGFQGAVAQFDLASGDLLNTFTDSMPGSSFGFPGTAIATYGDTLLVGATIFDGVNPVTGAVYQLDSDGNVLQTFSLPAGRNSFGGFGSSITVNGDQMLVGDQGDTVDYDGNAVMNGSVYIYDLTDEGVAPAVIENPTPTETLENDADFNDAFGITGGALSDGRFIIGNPFDNNANGVDAGAVYVYAPQDTNTPPSDAAIATDSADNAVRNQLVTFTGSFTDPDENDGHTIAWDFGDGATVEGSLNVGHAYTEIGQYTVTLTVTDAANESTSAEFVVDVTASGVQGGVLYVGGTDGNDAITVGKSGTGGVIVSGVPGTFTGGRVVIFAGDGNDTVNMGGSVGAVIEVHGGAGNDTVKGGNGGNILIGDDGDDSLVGGSGRDLIIGGKGADSLAGQPADDVIVAGYSLHESNPASLWSTYQVWASGDSYAERVAMLAVTALEADVDVFDDGAVDTLAGVSGQDYFMFNADGAIRDIINDLKKDELTSDVDPAPVLIV